MMTVPGPAAPAACTAKPSALKPHQNVSWTDSLPRQAQILLTVANTSGTPPIEESSLAQLCGDHSDWDAAIKLAAEHGMLTHLYRAVDGHVPGDFGQSLKDMYRRHTFRNMASIRQLLSLVGKCQSEQIPVLPFKGPVLSLQAHGDVALRSYGDLDVLLRKVDYRRVCQILESFGFTPCYNLNSKSQEQQLELGGQWRWEKKGCRAVELHTQLMPRIFRNDLTFEELWQRRQEMDFPGMRVPTFSSEDTLLYLAVHGNKHCWTRLGWVFDIAQFIESQPHIDWEQVGDQAQKLKQRRALGIALNLTNQLCGTPLPPVADPTLQRQTQPAVDYLREHIFDPVDPEGRRRTMRPYGIRDTAWLHVQGTDRRYDRIRYLFRMFAAPDTFDLRTVSLPRPLQWVYWIIRPFRLAWRKIARIRNKG